VTVVLVLTVPLGAVSRFGGETFEGLGPTDRRGTPWKWI
jgi:hypothetical protein